MGGRERERDGRERDGRERERWERERWEGERWEGERWEGEREIHMIAVQVYVCRLPEVSNVI